MNTLLRKLTFSLLGALLLASLAGNYYLYKKATLFYAREAAIRISPISSRYAADNENVKSREKTKPRLVIFGESRSGMWAPHHAKNWGDIEIINRGIGGETTPQIIRRMDEDVIALQPDVVVLQMGDNDLKTIAVLPGTGQRTFEQTYSNITSIAKTLSDKGIEVVITTIFPPGPIEFFRKPLWSDEVNESIDLMNQKLLTFDYPRVTTANCDTILRSGKFIKPEFSRDTLHLTPAGYAALNEGLAPIIVPIIARSKQ